MGVSLATTYPTANRKTIDNGAPGLTDLLLIHYHQKMPTSSSTVSLHEPVIWAIKVMIHPVYGCIVSYMIASDVDGHLQRGF